MICLTNNFEKKDYLKLFATGSELPIYPLDYDFGNETIVLRGMGVENRSLINWCLENNHDFYYIDSGYMGNYKSKKNPNGWKLWHRIVKNDLQHNKIIERPDDRWKRFGFKINSRIKGRHVLLVVPSSKPCNFYGIDKDVWIRETVEKIKQYTDRPIKIREKQSRKDRLTNTIFDDLKDCHALVTYQSIAAVESIMSGVPAFTLAPTAADPVANKDLSKLEDPEWHDTDTLHKWGHHLAYGQFHTTELKYGKAYKLLNES